ncbi:MAG: SLC13 family permease [Burkholderiales bacterium]
MAFCCAPPDSARATRGRTPPAARQNPLCLLSDARIIGAVLMVAFRIVGARDALASIDVATIVLLFSMMLVVANLRVAGFFERIADQPDCRA